MIITKSGFLFENNSLNLLIAFAEVFAFAKAGSVFGPTGGYLIGMIVAALFIGWTSDKKWASSYFKIAGVVSFGTALIFLCGLVTLSFYIPNEQLLMAGLYPYLPGAIIKIGLATIIASPLLSKK